MDDLLGSGTHRTRTSVARAGERRHARGLRENSAKVLGPCCGRAPIVRKAGDIRCADAITRTAPLLSNLHRSQVRRRLRDTSMRGSPKPGVEGPVGSRPEAIERWGL